MLFHEFKLDNTDQLNADLYARFLALSGTDRTRQTHHFGGRFENIYIEAADIPEITMVLDMMRQQVGQLLGISAHKLKVGYWFNAMETGHRTAPHHHDENDELYSAVYYIRVPDHSGNLILHHDGEAVVIQPQAGKLIIFPPNVMHEVTVNRSAEMRLSVGMNVGPKD